MGYTPKIDGATHAFCESSWATSLSPWHIRALTKIGPKFGGGADTDALCGRKVAWDLDVVITEHHLSHACQGCVAIWNDRGLKP